MAATVAALNGSMTPNAEGGQQGQDGGDLLGQLLAAGLKYLASDLFKEQVESAVNTVRATVSDAVQHLDMAYDSLSTLEKVQLTLDVVSVGLEASVIGAPLAMVADLASAVLSLAQGDWLGFGLGLAAIVPVVGLAANAARLGRHADLVEDAMTFCRFSFDGATLVRTEDGFVPIEDIRPREASVLARDEETGAQAYKPVLAQHRSRYDETVRVAIRDLETGAEQTLAANRVHPFYVADEVSELRLVAAGGGTAPVIGTNATGRWVQAHNLIAGDRLLNADEGWSEVTAVRVERKPLLAYNLTVADFHTFFVKAPEANDNDAVWVHNTVCDVDLASRAYDRPFIETKSGQAVRQRNALTDWDEFLGPGQTNIDPRDGLPDPDRIWSADGMRSIRFGPHEMNSGQRKLHYHKETWRDYVVENVLQRVQD